MYSNKDNTNIEYINPSILHSSTQNLELSAAASLGIPSDRVKLELGVYFKFDSNNSTMNMTSSDKIVNAIDMVLGEPTTSAAALDNKSMKLPDEIEDIINNNSMVCGSPITPIMEMPTESDVVDSKMHIEEQLLVMQSEEHVVHEGVPTEMEPLESLADEKAEFDKLLAEQEAAMNAKMPEMTMHVHEQAITIVDVKGELPSCIVKAEQEAIEIQNAVANIPLPPSPLPVIVEVSEQQQQEPIQEEIQPEPLPAILSVPQQQQLKQEDEPEPVPTILTEQQNDENLQSTLVPVILAVTEQQQQQQEPQTIQILLPPPPPPPSSPPAPVIETPANADESIIQSADINLDADINSDDDYLDNISTFSGSDNETDERASTKETVKPKVNKIKPVIPETTKMNTSENSTTTPETPAILTPPPTESPTTSNAIPKSKYTCAKNLK